MTNHEQYLNLVDELLARGVSPNMAARAALKMSKAKAKSRYSESYLPNISTTGSAAEILDAAKKSEPGRFERISVTILSAALRNFAKCGDPRVKILPKSQRCKKSVRFALNN
jgi:hypothetical protein